MISKEGASGNYPRFFWYSHKAVNLIPMKGQIYFKLVYRDYGIFIILDT